VHNTATIVLDEPTVADMHDAASWAQWEHYHCCIAVTHITALLCCADVFSEAGTETSALTHHVMAANVDVQWIP
jgi:hypothetical protein